MLAWAIVVFFLLSFTSKSRKYKSMSVQKIVTFSLLVLFYIFFVHSNPSERYMQPVDFGSLNLENVCFNGMLLSPKMHYWFFDWKTICEFNWCGSLHVQRMDTKCICDEVFDFSLPHSFGFSFLLLQINHTHKHTFTFFPSKFRFRFGFNLTLLVQFHWNALQNTETITIISLGAHMCVWACMYVFRLNNF